MKVGDSPEERDGKTGTSTRTEVAGGPFTNSDKVEKFLQNQNMAEKEKQMRLTKGLPTRERLLHNSDMVKSDLQSASDTTK